MTQARFQTMRHIETVRNYLGAVVRELLTRGEQHDQSKLASPEVEAFEVLTARLRGSTYGSDAYKASIKAFKPAITHHYQGNRHHPEHFPGGIEGMTLIDLIEMLCDWKAATLRHDTGDIYASLTINTERFAIGPQLRQILLNTVDWMEDLMVPHHADES